MKKMNKRGKEEIVKWLTEELKKSKIYILGNFSGLSVSEMQNLREGIKEKAGIIKVVKNTLLERTFKNLSQDKAIDYLEGPVFIIWTKDGDEVEILKNIYSFSKKTGKIEVKGGVINNKIVDREFFEKLSKLPPIKEIQAKVIYDVRFPVIKLINSIKAPVVKIVNIVNQIKKKKERENG